MSSVLARVDDLRLARMVLKDAWEAGVAPVVYADVMREFNRALDDLELGERPLASCTAVLYSPWYHPTTTAADVPWNDASARSRRYIRQYGRQAAKAINFGQPGGMPGVRYVVQSRVHTEDWTGHALASAANLPYRVLFGGGEDTTPLETELIKRIQRRQQRSQRRVYRAMNQWMNARRNWAREVRSEAMERGHAIHRSLEEALRNPHPTTFAQRNALRRTINHIITAAVPGLKSIPVPASRWDYTAMPHVAYEHFVGDYAVDDAANTLLLHGDIMHAEAS